MSSAAVGITCLSCQEDGDLPPELSAELARLQESGAARVVRRVRIAGLTGDVVADERTGDSDTDLVVPVLTPWLLASGVLFGDYFARVLEQHKSGRAIVLPILARPVSWGGTPIGAVRAARLDTAGAALGSAAAELSGGANGGTDGVTEPASEPAPKYEDEGHRKLGERLWALLALKAAGVEVGKAIADVTRDLRKGPQLRAGEVIADGRFRLLEPLGQGLLTTAWKAWDRAERRLVTVKFLHVHLASDRDRVSRFWDSAKRAAAIPHRNLVPIVHAQGEEHGFPYFVAEFQEGGALEKALAEGRIGKDDAIQAILDVAAGLAHAHAAGLLHRDIAPSNVLLGRDGTARLADFDVLVDMRAQNNMGSVYTAPETMDPGYKPDVRTDVYALGMTAAFAFHGQALPFWVLRSPERLIASLPCNDAIKNTLRAALDWDLDKRLGNVTALADAIRADHDLVRRLADAAAARERWEVAKDHWRFLLEHGATDVANLRVKLAGALEATGQLGRASRELLAVLDEPGLDADTTGNLLATLRRIAERTGDWDTFLAALEGRIAANDPRSGEYRVESARLTTTRSTDRAAIAGAWRRVLEHHTDRKQAREALEHLSRIAREDQDWPASARYGKELLPLIEPADRPALQAAIGNIFLDKLNEQQDGLLWLERALEGGHADPAIIETLERIRSARGEWKKVVRLMRDQARRQDPEKAAETLVRAARITLYAHHRVEEAVAIHQEIVERVPAHADALRFLARHHSRLGNAAEALALYARIPTGSGETDDRVADGYDQARLLALEDRTTEAISALEAVLELSPGHLPSLELAADLYADHRNREGVRRVAARIIAATAAVGPVPALVGAMLALADTAWLAGDIPAAGELYQRVLRVDPGERRAWWGVAKTAIGANSAGEPAKSEAQTPWLHVAPVKFTPHEGLARLLAGLLEPDAMTNWLRLVPGGEPTRFGTVQPPIVLASAVVDLLARRRLVGPALFQRLTARFPGWKGRIDAVRRLWCEPAGDSAFPVADSYGWGPAIAREFDRAYHRDVLHLEPALTRDPAGPDRHGLRSESAWEALLLRENPLPDAGPAAEARAEAPAEERAGDKAKNAAFVAYEGRGKQRVLVMRGDVLRIGSAENDDYKYDAERFAPSHVVIHHAGAHFYVEDGSLGRGVRVNDRPVTEARLNEGDAIEVSGVEFRFCSFEGDEPPFTVPAADDPTEIVGEGDVEEIVVEPLSEEAPLVAPPAPEEEETVASRPTPILPARKAGLFQRDAVGEYMYAIAKDVFTIGTAETDDINLADDAEPGVSARIERRSTGDYVLHDGSGSRKLTTGDKVVVGPMTYEFRILGETPPPAPPRRQETPSAKPRPAALYYGQGPKEGRNIPLLTFPFTIGRGRDTNLQIGTDASLSRVHCKIDKRGGDHYVHDCGSSNGTRVNGERITQWKLNDGDRITIGSTDIDFRAVAPEDTGEVKSSGPYVPTGTTAQPPPTRAARAPTAREALSLDEGLSRIAVANVILSAIITATNKMEGAGRGEHAIQVAIDGGPKAHAWLFEGAKVGTDGLPSMDLMYNVARRPEREQRRALNAGLLDLIERSISVAGDTLPEAAAEELLERVAQVRYRDELRG